MLISGLVGHIEQSKLQMQFELSRTQAEKYNNRTSLSRMEALQDVVDSLDYGYLFGNYAPYKAGAYWTDLLTKATKKIAAQKIVKPKTAKKK